MRVHATRTHARSSSFDDTMHAIAVAYAVAVAIIVARVPANETGRQMGVHEVKYKFNPGKSSEGRVRSISRTRHTLPGV